MVVQKLEAQHDAGSIESAGGEDDNIKLVTEQREVYKDSLLTMSSRSPPKQIHLQPDNGSCCVTVKLQNV